MLVPTIDGVPVLLPPHEHPEFGDPGLHYHVDYRFTDLEIRQNRVIHSTAEPALVDLPQVREVYTVTTANPKLLTFLAGRHTHANCGRCPHKGFPIMDGVCPGHGLVFNTDGSTVREYGFSVLGKVQYWRPGMSSVPFTWEREVLVDHVYLRAGDRTIGEVKMSCTMPIPVKPGDILLISV